MKEYSDVYVRFAVMNMVEEDGKIWMALLNRNGICEVDKATRQAKIRKVFDGELLTRKFLYSKTEKVGDNLVFAPWDAESIAVYNLKDDAVTYFPLNARPQKLKESSVEAKFLKKCLINPLSTCWVILIPQSSKLLWSHYQLTILQTAWRK